MSRIETRLAEIRIKLPQPLVLPSSNRTSAVLVDKMLYVSGHGAALLEDETVDRPMRPPERLRSRCLPRSSITSVISTGLHGS